MACSRCADAEQGGCSCWDQPSNSMVDAVRDRRRREGGGIDYGRPNPCVKLPPSEYTAKDGTKGTLEVYTLAPVGRIPAHGKRWSDMDRGEHDAWRGAKWHVDNGDLTPGVEQVFPGEWDGIAVTWRPDKG